MLGPVFHEVQVYLQPSQVPRTQRLTIDPNFIQPLPEKPQRNVSQSHFTWVLTWDIDWEIDSMSPEMRVPAQCLANRKKNVPFHLRDRVITLAHNSPATGHPGTHIIHQLLQSRYMGPCMLQDIPHVPKPKCPKPCPWAS